MKPDERRSSDDPTITYFEYDDGSIELSIEFFGHGHGPGSRTLLITTTGKLEYLKSWGPNMNTEMEDGDINNPDEFYKLLAWINEREKGP